MIFRITYVTLVTMLKTKYKNIFDHQDSYWWYKGMAAINILLLKKYLPKKNNLKILDIGCGTGAALLYLSDFGDVIGVDKSDEALKFAKTRGKVMKGDIASLPFKDDTFDLVVCLDVLYHEWVHTKKAFLEIKRVVKPGGIVLIREPAFDWFRSSEDIASQTKHRFTTNELKRELMQSFDIVKLTYLNFFLFPIAFLKRLPEIIGIKKKKGISDASSISPVCNNILFYIFLTEPMVLNYINFPFGTSALCVARKK